MSSTSPMDESVRTRIIANPETLLEDVDIMRALVAANDKGRGNNVIDLRGIAMQRLEARLDRLEDAHRSVIAAAYDNLAGTHQIHRAILRLLEAPRFDDFMADLDGEVADILRLDAIRLVLESAQQAEDSAIAHLPGVLTMAGPGFVKEYLTGGRKASPRPVTLRQVPPEASRIYGEKARRIGSEACLLLDLGEGRLPGLLALGAGDRQHFNPQQGTDLLTFFAGVFERAMRRWLS